jgi:tRNA threonylcarbamoyl adenosine modification protein (Sua5/YciO/YrdC/YwlC family)
MDAFWPGPLTVVLSRTAESEAWALGGDSKTIGVRMPDHSLALAVLEGTGPLAVTSANLSGRPTPATCAGVAQVFAEKVSVYVCDERPLAGKPSSVVDLTSEEPKVLRQGRLSDRELLAALTA